MDPIWIGNAIAVTEELNGGCTEGSPLVGVFCLLLWSCQRLAHQVGPDVFCIPVPRIGKVAKSGPGIFFLTDLLVSPCHGLNRCRHFSLPLVINLVPLAEGFQM